MRDQSKKDLNDIESVRNKYEAEIMAIPGVTGIGIGEGNHLSSRVIKVYVDGKSSDLEKRIPKELEGYPVKTEVTGEFKAL
jgi:hypothetical protein